MNRHPAAWVMILALLVTNPPSVADEQQTSEPPRRVSEQTAQLLRRQLRERRREVQFTETRLRELAAQYSHQITALAAAGAIDTLPDLPSQEVEAFFAARQQRLRSRLVEVNHEISRIRSRLEATSAAFSKTQQRK